MNGKWVFAAMLIMTGFSLTGLAMLSREAKPDLTVHVRPGGDDAGPGTAAQPVGTLAKARDMVRETRKQRPLNAGAEIILHGGRYVLDGTLELSAEDAGTSAAPIRYRAARGEQPVLAGSAEIPAGAFTLLADPERLARLEAPARGKVVVADLKALGFPAMPKLRAVFRMPMSVPELFCDGRRMTLACWPNEGFAQIVKILDKGTQRGTGAVSDAADPKKQRTRENRGGCFTYEGDRPARWKADEGVWLHGFWCFDWYDDVIQVASIDAEKKEIRLQAAHEYGVRQGNPSPRRWRAVNVFDELDVPGEYAVDPQAGRLYFYPPQPLAGARITLAFREEPLVRMRDLAHVILEGLTFEETQGDALRVAGCSHVTVSRCVFRNHRRRAVVVEGGVKNRITSCDIHDTGVGGVSLAGGDRKTLTPAGHVLEDTHIWRYSTHLLTYSTALHLSGVGNVARHNLFHDAPHMAVAVSGNDHLFEYNVVSNVVMASDDAGALYKGRNPSCRGNVIRYNLWSEIGSPRGHGTAAIYFDDGDGGDTVYGNLFYRCGDPGKGSFGTVFSHGGHGNVAENNVFIECKRALGSAPWNDKRWKQFIDAPLWQERLLREVHITGHTYTSRYPELIGFMDPQPGATRENIAVRNLFVACDGITKGNWNTNAVYFATADDPGFVNCAARDFRLKRNAAVWQRMPGFKPLPLEKMGLLRKR